MFKNISTLAAIALISMPLSAQAVSPGHDMLARLANVDGATYSLDQTAQIAAEKGDHRRQLRANFIADQQTVTGAGNPGHQMQADLLGVQPDRFTPAELAQIAAEKGDQHRRDRAAYILEQKRVSTAPNAGLEMEARLLGLNPAAFSASELGQIAAEKNDGQRQGRAQYIAGQRVGV